jgi:hypothetical protein
VKHHFVVVKFSGSLSCRTYNVALGLVLDETPQQFDVSGRTKLPNLVFEVLDLTTNPPYYFPLGLHFKADGNSKKRQWRVVSDC